MQYFSVTLGLEETDPEIMKPGQRVRATLVLVELDAAIVVPRQAVFEKEGKKFIYRVVYRQGGSGFEEVEVRLGPSSLGRVVLQDGISEGDAIALRDLKVRQDLFGYDAALGQTLKVNDVWLESDRRTDRAR